MIFLKDAGQLDRAASTLINCSFLQFKTFDIDVLSRDLQVLEKKVGAQGKKETN